MGQCGITSSKTVLVFLNLIFWVSKPFAIISLCEMVRKAEIYAADFVTKLEEAMCVARLRSSLDWRGADGSAGTVGSGEEAASIVHCYT